MCARACKFVFLTLWNQADQHLPAPHLFEDSLQCLVVRCRFLQSLMSEFNQTADDLMNYLVEQADGRTRLTMLTHLTHFALDVIGKVRALDLSQQDSLVFVCRQYTNMSIAFDTHVLICKSIDARTYVHAAIQHPYFPKDFSGTCGSVITHTSQGSHNATKLSCSCKFLTKCRCVCLCARHTKSNKKVDFAGRVWHGHRQHSQPEQSVPERRAQNARGPHDAHQESGLQGEQPTCCRSFSDRSQSTQGQMMMKLDCAMSL